MNRTQRRELMKQGASKETVDKLSEFEKPAKLKEVLAISRAVAQDVASEYVEDYRRRSAGVIMAMTLQVEMLKELVIKNGLITEDEFNALYEIRRIEFEEAQSKYIMEQLKAQEEAEKSAEAVPVSAKTDVVPVGPVEVETSK